MKIYFLFFITILFFISCKQLKKFQDNQIDYLFIYNELKVDNNFMKFIGYHIVRRDNLNYFMFRNLMIDSSNFVVPVLNATEGTRDYKEKELFFKKYPDAKIQLYLMKKLKLQAVLTLNYNQITNKLEYDYGKGVKFKNYELEFAVSEYISITHINFNFNDYLNIIREDYDIIERLESNWFVLKRK